jgi:putative sugar O-methyltransferase
MKNEFYGWIATSDEEQSSYSESCLKASQDDEEFANFKKNDGYRKILEGAPKLFSDYYFQRINSHNEKDLFYQNLESFKENDKLGNPDLYEEEGVGLISPSTLKFASNCLDIISFIKQFEDLGKVKNIVEIGGGYGGLCLILSNFIEFDSYTLIDLPEAANLADKYLSNFKEIYSKVNCVSCNDLDQIEHKEFDLCIAVNSLSECDLDTQLNYFDKFVSKSKYSYIVRNPDTQERINHHKKTIETLSDNFSVDDTNRVEEWYSSNIIVYVKKDD